MDNNIQNYDNQNTVNNVQNPEVNPDPPKKSKNKVIIIVLAVVIVILAVAVAFLVGKLSSGEDNDSISITEEEDDDDDDKDFKERVKERISEVKSDDWKNVDDGTGDLGIDEVVIDELTPGTYGGVRFSSLDDVANYYVSAYNYTKSLTAQYDENGETKTYYKLLGDESMEIDDVIVDGSKNAVVNNLVPGIVDGMFKPNTYGLVPCYNRNPDLDNNSDDEHKKKNYDFRTTTVTGDDILAANVTDNKDGTITIVIQPKMAVNSMRGDDSQGRFFEVLGDISGVVGDLSAISFTQGEAKDNVNTYYKGGTVTVTIDTRTKEITEADYVMETTVYITHASIAVIRDKNATLNITYKNHYPASDEYLEENKGITRK